MTDRDEILRKGGSLTQMVLKMAVNEKLQIVAEDFYNYYQYNYNEAKGETPSGELDRWLRFIYDTKRIIHIFSPDQRAIYFKRLED